uniref:AlNc14C30G2834 protein n=1 Tax=Albugo laibachii Nc14 TaxID=890382 RepID=F0W7M9_9STRA|nr:AlNc14C30G2834 [Albugo laibachii Nc14]|eukprot:CCA17130.1 AlNc14C30G2834 [Albugo laibachii Nc14]
MNIWDNTIDYSRLCSLSNFSQECALQSESILATMRSQQEPPRSSSEDLGTLALYIVLDNHEPNRSWVWIVSI